MNKIVEIKEMAPKVKYYVIEAELIAKHCLPGQFIILRVDEDGERVPLTISDYDRKAGTISLLVQEVGYSTMQLAKLKVGDYIHDVVGPLGNATNLDEYENVLLVGGGIGCAVIFPQAKLRKEKGLKSEAILGARTKDLLYGVEGFEENCDNVYIATDDGSLGTKGFVTTVLQNLIDEGKKIDCVFVVGPMIMMKNVAELTKPYGIPTVVSMNCIMVDGTGMCGGCRLTVDGETKYACVDGPEFDGHKVDFAGAMKRSRFYKEHEDKCRLRG